MNKVDVKFGEWIQGGFELYKNNLGLLILASLVAMLISGITFGILAGPMCAGLVLIVLALYDKKSPKPEMGMVFKGFEYFLNSFLFFIVWGLITFVVMIVLNFIPILGQLATIFLVYAVQALLMFGLFLIVDKKMEFWPASMESINIVKANFWPFLGLSFVAGIIGGIGSILCGIGAIITMPIYFCIIAIAYRSVFATESDSPVASAAPEPPITPEPPVAPEEPEAPEATEDLQQ